jgi:WD40-like Beta Propeller Repeat
VEECDLWSGLSRTVIGWRRAGWTSFHERVTALPFGHTFLFGFDTNIVARLSHDRPAMPTTDPVGNLIRRGVQLQPHEAVALAQSVIAALADDLNAHGECGPPTIETVHIGADGAVTCPGCATPSVFEIGLFLDSMLRHGCGIKVPGALQYLVARALGEVDAPRFASVAEVSQVLTRYEDGDSRTVVAGLFARASASPTTTTGHPTVGMRERRRTTISATELRRYLHDLDRELFLARSRSGGVPSDGTAVPVPTPPRVVDPVPTSLLARTSPAPRRGQALVGAASVAALALLALTPLILNRAPQRRTVAPPTPASVVSEAPRVEDSPATPSDGQRFRGGSPASKLPGPVSSATDSGRSQTPPPESTTSQSAGSVVGGPSPIGLKPAANVPAPEAAVVRAVARAEDPEFSSSFASDGTALFLHTGRTADARSALVSAGSLDGDLRVMKLVDDGARNYHVQPSPDGTRIAFDSDRDGERGVYVATHVGTDVRRVSGAGFAAMPTWSPDATRLTFVRTEPDRPRVWNLWLLTLASGEMRQLTRFRYGQTWSGSWFPDGRRICYTHEDRVVVLDLEGSTSQEYLTPVPQRLVRMPAVSPDGQRVVFQVYRDGAWMLNLKDGSMVRILTDPSAEEFAWSPDGRRVAFHSRRDGEWGIWMMGPP